MVPGESLDCRVHQDTAWYVSSHPSIKDSRGIGAGTKGENLCSCHASIFIVMTDVGGASFCDATPPHRVFQIRLKP